MPPWEQRTVHQKLDGIAEKLDTILERQLWGQKFTKSEMEMLYPGVRFGPQIQTGKDISLENQLGPRYDEPAAPYTK